MKKTAIFCLFLFLVLNFISCSEDTTNNTESYSIVGTWELESFSKEGHIWDMAEWPNEYTRIWKFKSDSTLSEFRGIGESWSYLHFDLLVIYPFDWEIKDGMLIITGSGEGGTIKLDLTEEHLTFTYQGSGDDLYILIYKRQ